MMKKTFTLVALIAAFPAFAENARELDAHEHGVGTLNIAIDGTTVAMKFEAPGADIVGFEYAAKSDADLAAIDTAISTLGAPLDLFVMSDAASCSLEDAHDDHEDEAGHTEFHAKYTLTCDDPDALSKITFAYFEAFPNAQEVEMQMITASGAQAFEVTRDAPILDLGR